MTRRHHHVMLEHRYSFYFHLDSKAPVHNPDELTKMPRMTTITHDSIPGQWEQEALSANQSHIPLNFAAFG